MPPRVTVIIATYNWSSVLPYSIGSVLDQTFTDFELLVVGDECTDDSEHVVARIPDRRVRWINFSPGTRHQYGPNNEGLRQAQGDIVAYLGHDDLWLPRHLELGVAAIDRGADVAHLMALAIAPDGTPIQLLTKTRAGWMPPSAVVHRRSLVDRVGGWRDYRTLSLGPEHDLWLRASRAGLSFEFVDRLTVVKFSASLRRNVYREKPSHEQAAWLARIRSEPDLEAVESTKLRQSHRSGRGLSRRAWRLLLEPSQWLAFVWRRHGARIKARQRFKGVDSSRH